MFQALRQKVSDSSIVFASFLTRSSLKRRIVFLSFQVVKESIFLNVINSVEN